MSYWYATCKVSKLLKADYNIVLSVRGYLYVIPNYLLVPTHASFKLPSGGGGVTIGTTAVSGIDTT